MENYSGGNRRSWTQSPAVRPASPGPHFFLCSRTVRALSLLWGEGPPHPGSGAWAVQARVRVGQPKSSLREGPFLPPGGALISGVEIL